MTQRERMTKQLAMYDFMLDDIILYLDTHPNCRMALAAFNKYRRQIGRASCRERV